MLRSEPRPTPEALDELDRLDAALRAHRRGERPTGGPRADAVAGSADGRDATADRDAKDDLDAKGDLDATADRYATDGRNARGAGEATADDLDGELLALVADVRASRPELDAGARMRLEERVAAAQAAPAPRSRPRLTTDRRWRAGLALAAVVAVAVPAGSVLVRDGGSDGEVAAEATSLRAPSGDARDAPRFSGAVPESAAGSSSSGDSSSSATGSPSSGDSASSGGQGQQDRRSPGTA
ncbi:MAG: hypothetical protein F2817_20640, partial [Actinobacteria bacterium]|nr:hypothetical protein [Actinomycetota bacterium]